MFIAVLLLLSKKKREKVSKEIRALLFCTRRVISTGFLKTTQDNTQAPARGFIIHSSGLAHSQQALLCGNKSVSIFSSYFLFLRFY
jgi:hypothetical protein